jgi:diaminopimelate decarboxylase
MLLFWSLSFKFEQKAPNGDKLSFADILAHAMVSASNFGHIEKVHILPLYANLPIH